MTTRNSFAIGSVLAFAALSAAVLAPSQAQAYAALDVSPNWVRFNNVPAKTGTRSIRLTVRNTGTEPLFGFRVVGSGATSSYSQLNHCAHLLQYATCTVTVKFHPQRAGKHTMNLEIRAGVAFGRVYFQGTAIEPTEPDEPIEIAPADASEARE